MKKFNRTSLLALVSLACTFFATSVATSACYFFLYQPEEPTSLN